MGNRSSSNPPGVAVMAVPTDAARARQGGTRCQLFSGVYESDGKCYCEIAIPTQGVSNEIYFKIAARLEDLLKGDKRYENVGNLI